MNQDDEHYEYCDFRTLDILEGDPSLGELKLEGWVFVDAENGRSYFKRLKKVRIDLEYKMAYDD